MPPPPPPKKKKQRGPAQATEEQILDRAKGALLGLCVGEALGAPNRGRALMAAQFPELNDGPVDMRPNGPFERRAGQVSWASELAVCLANALRTFNGFDAEETARTYLRWLPDALEVPEPVRQALEYVKEGRGAEFSGRRVWLDAHQQVRDNAALARVAPIAVFFLHDRDARVHAALVDAAITHFSPICRLANATYCAVLAALLSSPTEQPNPVEVLKQIESELSLAAVTLARLEPDWVQVVKDSADVLREDIRASQVDDPMLYGPELYLFKTPTHVRVTLRLALWELFHAPSFEGGLLDVVNRGGEADINAAVTGALLGALQGERACPELWREAVLECWSNRGTVHWSVYHPQYLLTLEPKPRAGT